MSDDRLERLLRTAREEPVEAPPFRALWDRALELRRRRRSRRVALRLAAAASAVVLVALLLLLLVAPGPELAPEAAGGLEIEELELARSLSGWGGPLDFLLEPPGGHLFGVDPETEILPAPGELPDPDLEEVL